MNGMLTDLTVGVIVFAMVVLFWMTVGEKRATRKITIAVLEMAKQSSTQLNLLTSYVALQEEHIKLERENAILLEEMNEKFKVMSITALDATKNAVNFIDDLEYTKKLDETVEVEIHDDNINESERL